MKYLMLVGDGMADEPLAELNGMTPLEYAHTPAMDSVASRGRVGLVRTVPDGMPPGSDVANMSLLGYDPAAYYSGRAPIEAASMGVEMGGNDTAFRCNLVNIKDGLMADYSAGHIESADAVRLVTELQQLNSDTVRFYPGVSYRHLLIISGFPAGALECTPPHDITGRPIDSYLPKGAGSTMLMELANKACNILKDSPVNRERIAHGKTPATNIWLWGQGKAVVFPTLHDRFGLSGSVISAVDLVRGLGKLAGLAVRKVEGATGYLGTNYAGKMQAARDALRREDFAFVHVEAPDETSHEGSLAKKLQAIEEFDAHVAAEGLKMCGEIADLRLMILPDHPTLLSTKTHDASPVPFAVCGAGIRPAGVQIYSEKSAQGATMYTGTTLFEEFINGDFE